MASSSGHSEGAKDAGSRTRTMIGGNMASAASVDGATAPTSNPKAEAATLFSAVRPRNRRNFRVVLPNFAKGYRMPPKRHDRPTDRGSSAATLENK